MWNSNFELDGPGLASADFADELGVVMSMSHHEPCMRSSQEYSMVRGKGSEYGDAWDFNANPKGITKFWRDGLVRTADKEQVITMDMHGGPHAFQWIGSSYLPKIQNQMTTAYDYGVREIWVTNIGDIGTQDFGLSYFLDLAYDIEKWGHAPVSQSITYRKNWIEKQFATWFTGSTESRGTDLMLLTTLQPQNQHPMK